MNSTIVLTRLTTARNEGGVASAITAAQALVGQYYPGRTFDVAVPVNTVFAALDRGNLTGAETAINEALATLARPEAAAAPVAAEAGNDHEARLAALETIARNNGYGHLLTGGNTVEARLTALETAARRAGLR